MECGESRPKGIEETLENAELEFREGNSTIENSEVESREGNPTIENAEVESRVYKAVLLV